MDSYDAEDFLRNCVNEESQNAHISQEIGDIKYIATSPTPALPKKNKLKRFFESFKRWNREHARIIFGFSRY
jgi:hypothetical protein